MWPWKRRIDEDPVRTLTGRVDDVESAVRRLKTEWLDTLERIERIAGRLSKRAQREVAALAAPYAPP